MADRYYNIVKQLYSIPQKIDLDILCNGVTVKNIGNSICVIDNDPLQPFESESIGGNKDEIFYGRHNISFQPAVPQPLPRVDLAVVTQKFYIESPKVSGQNC